MEWNGWRFAPEFGFNSGRKDWMGDTALSGGVEHEPMGWLEITLQGYGNIAVNYTSGYNGMVDVYVNGVSKHQLNGEKSQDTVDLLFTDGDVIRIAEGSDGKPGILVLNSVDITCGGMFLVYFYPPYVPYFHSFVC